MAGAKTVVLLRAPVDPNSAAMTRGTRAAANPADVLGTAPVPAAKTEGAPLYALAPANAPLPGAPAAGGPGTDTTADGTQTAPRPPGPTPAEPAKAPTDGHPAQHKAAQDKAAHEREAAGGADGLRADRAAVAARAPSASPAALGAARELAQAQGEPHRPEPAPEAPEPALDLPRLEPLEPTRADLAFEAPLSLDRAQLKLPPAPANTPPQEVEAALATAIRQYGRIAQSALEAQQRIVAQVEEARGGIAQRYAASGDRLLAHCRRLDEELEAPLRGALQLVDASAERADQTIEREYQLARRKLGATAAGAKAAIHRNGERAKTDFESIVKEVALEYKKTLDELCTECDKEAAASTRALDAWVPELPRQFPDTGTAIHKVGQEGKRIAGEKLAKRAKDGLTKHTEGTKASLKGVWDGSGAKDKKSVEDQYRASPGLQQIKTYADEIAKKGNAAVNVALRKSTDALRVQATEALKNNAAMRKSGRGQLLARRRAARARLEAGARRALSDSRNEARSAGDSLAGVMRNAAPVYARSTTRFADTLARAGQSGHQSLAKAATTGAPQVERALAQARGQQSERIQTSSENTRGSLERRERQAADAAQHEAREARRELGAAAELTGPQIEEAALRIGGGFGKLSEGVRDAAAQWIKPLDKTFEKFIKDTKAGIANNRAKDKESLRTALKGYFDYVKGTGTPAAYFAAAQETACGDAEKRAREAAITVIGQFDKFFGPDRAPVTAALRGITRIQGDFVKEQFDDKLHRPIELAIAFALPEDDADAVRHFLAGETELGVMSELKASMRWYNDDEARIESIMRSLTPDQLEKLKAHKDWQGVKTDVQDALGGSDLKVFDALEAGKPEIADAVRMMDNVDEKRSDNDIDAATAGLKQFGEGAAWGDATPEERRKRTMAAFAALAAEKGAVTADEKGPMTAEEVVLAYVTRPVDVVQYDQNGEMQVVKVKVEGANADLMGALIRHGEGSVDARTARLAVEMQRPGGPKIENVDLALVDDRLNKNTNVSPEERKQAVAERDEVARRYATKYGGAAASVDAQSARNLLDAHAKKAFGDDTFGGETVAALIQDEYPTPNTAARLMHMAMRGSGTNEDLIWRVLGRMDKDEIAQMRVMYNFGILHGSGDLYAEMGVFGHGWLGELSGDDRLKAERLLLGQPRNDKERAELAAFTVKQQKDETGWLGSALAGGGASEKMLDEESARLNNLVGGKFTVGADGKVDWEGGHFNDEGKFKGNAADFTTALATSKLAAETYQATIDSFASAVTMGIAILGAIAAAVATVLTAGAASPLLMASIAGIAGLTAIAANYAIKGGRYGWEQALVDLGITAVQALTAGLGQSLALASRGGAQAVSAGFKAGNLLKGVNPKLLGDMGRLTGSAFGDQLLIGAVTGGFGAAGNVAFSEKTWEKGIGHGIEEMLLGTVRGAFGGAAMAGVTNRLEAVKIGGSTIGDRIGQSTSPFARGLGRASLSTIGAITNRTAEIGFDVATGRLHGDAGDALESVGEAGKQAALQGIGEGMGEAGAQGFHNRMVARQRGVPGAEDLHGPAPRPTRAEEESAALRRAEEAGLPHPAATEALAAAAARVGPAEAAPQGMVMETQRPGAAPVPQIEPRPGVPVPEPTAAAAARVLPAEAAPVRPAVPEPLAAAGRAAEGVEIPGAPPVRAHAAADTPALESMRARLLEHLSPEVRAKLGDVEIRVLPEAEYRALTRSDAGPVVTIIRDGEPMVLIREGTDIARLADEGPHLAQAQDPATRAAVARLDEKVLAHWDKLNVDTQLDLYRNKIELEIGAHEQILRSIAAQEAAGTGDHATLAQARERAEGNLRALHERLGEVQAIGPSDRSAMAEGAQAKPQYLDQPARLFSKDAPRSPKGSRTAEVSDHIAAAVEEIQQRIRPGHAGTEAEPPHPTVPHEPPEGHPEARGQGRLFAQTPEQVQAHHDRLERGNTFNTEQEAGHRYNEVYIEVDGGGRVRLDSYDQDRFIVSRKYTQLAEIGEEKALAYIVELVDKYPKGARIAEVPSNQRLLAEARAALGAEGERLNGQHELRIPVQHEPVPRAVLEAAKRADVLIRDVEGRVYDLRHPDGERPVVRVTPRDTEQHADAMRDALLKHVPAEMHDQFAGVDIVVLAERDYLALTRSTSGPVVTIISNGKPIVVMREGTDIARLADEGPHLVQAHDPATQAAVQRLDERVLSRWDSLDIDTQLDLYRNKLTLEIDAHERILRSVAEQEAAGAADPQVLARTRERAEGNIAALGERLAEVTAIDPAQRADISSGKAPKPQYLDQPPRLFSKDPPQAPPEVTEGQARAKEESEARRTATEDESVKARAASRAEAEGPPSPRPSFEPPDPLELVRLRAEQVGLEKRMAQDRTNLEAAERRHGEQADLLDERTQEREDYLKRNPRAGPDDPELRRLDASLRGLRRQVDQGQTTIEYLRKTVDSATRRLAEIEARRAEFIGDWPADYKRIGEHPPCFLAGTVVHTASGPRAIECIARGERVLAYDEEARRVVQRRVLLPECGRTTSVVDIGIGADTLSATPWHRFWRPDAHTWSEARSLAPGMQVLGPGGEIRIVRSVRERAADAPTYNLQVEHAHNYFVGSEGVLVHNGKDEEELPESIFLNELLTRPQPFRVRYYVIVHRDDPNTIIYVGSTEQTLADRLRAHVYERQYVRGEKAGMPWLDEAGATARVMVNGATEVQVGPFIMREFDSRVCHSHFERFVWELHFIERFRAAFGETMQNDFDSPPIGADKFEAFKDHYLAQLCA